LQVPCSAYIASETTSVLARRAGYQAPPKFLPKSIHRIVENPPHSRQRIRNQVLRKDCAMRPRSTKIQPEIHGKNSKNGGSTILLRARNGTRESSSCQESGGKQFRVNESKDVKGAPIREGSSNTRRLRYRGYYSSSFAAGRRRLRRRTIRIRSFVSYV